jgi:hypothetical protein
MMTQTEDPFEAKYDIVVTWPKDRRFASYMVELERAKMRGLQVNFRVPRIPDLSALMIEDHGERGLPFGADVRCYRVHDGYVRGWLGILGAEHRGLGAVARVPSDPLYNAPNARHWPPGNYIVCDPEWHTATRIAPMKGFRGWRWFNRELVGD